MRTPVLPYVVHLSRQGIVNNGYYSHASFEVRMGREDGCTMLGGGIITGGHDRAWDHVHIAAALGVWHHVAMVSPGGESSSAQPLGGLVSNSARCFVD